MFFSDCLLGNVIDFFAEKGRKVKLLRCGGPNGELGASLRYLSQRYTMPDDVTKGLLTDIGMSCPKCSRTKYFVPIESVKKSL